MNDHPISSCATVSLSANTAIFRRDVLNGLRQPHKSLPCKYFYDEIGSELFERICQQEEYYPTRCELEILQRHAAVIADSLGPDVAFIEYGSGSSRKTRLLLDHLHNPTAYLPVDINGEQLRESARRLKRHYPNLVVQPIEADFTQRFALPALAQSARRRVVYFSGSTIGNFEPHDALDLLTGIAQQCGRGGGLLLSVDLKKNPQILHAAYNDRRGVTAAFNLNLLARINRELNADFALERYDHYAFYNPVAGRVEMHLLSRAEQTVHLGRQSFVLAEGESIRTEHSYKYTLTECERMAQAAGMRRRQVWIDDDEMFSVQYYIVE